MRRVEQSGVAGAPPPGVSAGRTPAALGRGPSPGGPPPSDGPASDGPAKRTGARGRPRDGGPRGGRRARRGARALGGLALGLGLVSVFAGALFVGAVLHLDTPAARRATRTGANAVLSRVFEGKIVVGEITALDVGGAEIRWAEAFDPRGARVVRVEGVRAEADVLDLLRRIVLGRGDLDVRIPYVRVEHADVVVELRGDRVTLEEAFTPLEAGPGEEGRPGAPSRTVRVSMPKVEIARGYVHGLVAPPRGLDADVSRVLGAISVGPEGVTLDVERSAVVERGLLPATMRGTANYRLRSEPMRMWSTFAGKLGDATVVARAEMEGDYLRGTLDVPRASPEEIESVFPGAPFAVPVTARAAIEGPIPSFEVRAELSPHDATGLGGELEAWGELDAEGPLRIGLAFDARALDPRTFVAGAPAASVDAKGAARVELGDETRLDLDATTEPFLLLGTRVPGADVHVVLAEGAWIGRASLREPGMPTEVAVAHSPDGTTRFDARLEAPALGRVARLGLPLAGAASLRARGQIQGGELSARLDGDLRGLSAPGSIGLERGSFSGSLSGPLGDPRLDARLEGRGLALGSRSYDRAEIRARGPLLGALAVRASLDDPRQGRVEASARLEPAQARASAVRFSASSGGETLRGEASRLGRSRAGGVAIEGLRLEGGGLGEAEGALAIEDGEITGTLRAGAIDLQRLGRLVGSPMRLRGTASVDAHIERTKEGRKGHLHLLLEGGELSPLSGVSAHFAATFEGEKVKADALLRLVAEPHPGEPAAERCSGVIAALRLTGGEVDLDGPLTLAETYREATGSAMLALEDVDLRCLKKMVPVGLPIGDIRGRVAARLDLERPAGPRFVSIKNFGMQTRGLEIDGPQGLGDAEPAWTMKGVDVEAQGGLDGATGRAIADLTLVERDHHAKAWAQIDLDLPSGFDGERGLAEALAKAAESAPVAGYARLSRRPFSALEALPPFVRERLPPLAGEFRAEAYLAGTTREPKMALSLEGFGVVLTPGPGGTAGPLSVPLDATAVATYDLRRATLDARFSHRGREVAHATGDLDRKPGPPEGEPGAPAPPFRASLELGLREFPLGEVPFLADRDIGGHASGRIRAEGLGDRPSFEATIDAPDLQIGEDVYFEHGRLALSIGRRPGAERDTAEAHVELKAQDGGWLDASAFATVEWKDGLRPDIDRERPADFFAKVSRFRIATFQPLVAGVFSKVDGYLDGDLRFGFARAGAGGSVDAAMTVTEGVFHVPQLGQEFRGATATLVAQPPEGTGGGRPQPLAIGERPGDCGPDEHTIRLREVSAGGITGRIAGRAFGCLNGRLEFVSGGAMLAVPKGQEIPLTLEGVPLGRARGDFALSTRKEGRTIDTALVATRVHVELPPGTARDVQGLEEHPDVEVMQPLGPPEEARSGDALRWVLRVALDRAELEGSGLDVRLSSSLETGPRVELADETRVSGDVAVVEPSTFEVFGKTFDIERGLVRLRPEDPSNPYMNVRAHWDAPSGARVFVDYVGTLRPVTPEKLNFSSTPPRTPQEIISTLILGDDLVTPRQSTPRAEPGAGGVAAGVGGEIAAAQFNALLSGIAPLSGLTTSIGTTQAGAVRTSVAYELSDNVTFIGVLEEASATRPGGTPAPGGSPSNTRGAQGGVGFDLRLSRGWSLRTTFGLGPAPTMLDLLWQHRY